MACSITKFDDKTLGNVTPGVFASHYTCNSGNCGYSMSCSCHERALRVIKLRVIIRIRVLKLSKMFCANPMQANKIWLKKLMSKQ